MYIYIDGHELNSQGRGRKRDGRWEEFICSTHGLRRSLLKESSRMKIGEGSRVGSSMRKYWA